jgi:hypothetical protein
MQLPTGKALVRKEPVRKELVRKVLRRKALRRISLARKSLVMKYLLSLPRKPENISELVRVWRTHTCARTEAKLASKP